VNYAKAANEGELTTATLKYTKRRGKTDLHIF